MSSLRMVILAAACLCCFAAACSPHRVVEETVQPTPTARSTPVQPSPTNMTTEMAQGEAVTMPGTSPSPSPPITPSLPLPRYTLSTTLDYAAHHLEVEERIDYHNHSNDSLSELVLMIDPLYYVNTFHLDRISWSDGQPVVDYTWGTGELHLPLPQPLSPGENVSLLLSYHLELPSPVPSPDYRPIPFGYTARQTNLVDWYPFVAAYVSGKGWLAHPAGFFGEHLVYESADFEVNIRLTDDDKNLIIAASAADNQDGEWHRYHLDAARTFAWSVSHEYQVTSTQVGDVTVSSYYFPFHTSAGEAALRSTAEALELFSRLYVPYPHTTLSVVEADFLDGMEYDGLYFLSNGFYNLYQGDPASYLVAIAAHETAHQWFYGLVGNDQAEEPWLDEALCTYQERVFFEHEHPEALSWWWNYRVNYYQPQGWVDRSIYEAGGFRPYRDAVYLNGAMFLEEVRKQIGDEAFFGFLKDYIVRESYKIATTGDFFDLLKRGTDQDLNTLIAKYFRN